MRRNARLNKPAWAVVPLGTDLLKVCFHREWNRYPCRTVQLLYAFLDVARCASDFQESGHSRVRQDVNIPCHRPEPQESFPTIPASGPTGEFVFRNICGTLGHSDIRA
jgi:hypothetical protein